MSLIVTEKSGESNMNMQLFNQTKTCKLCWIKVTRQEALALIQSLAHQLLTGDPNDGRLESECTGDASELSICVKE
jgi:hypothetical protein